jgi:hypothetical protein
VVDLLDLSRIPPPQRLALCCPPPNPEPRFPDPEFRPRHLEPDT